GSVRRPPEMSKLPVFTSNTSTAVGYVSGLLPGGPRKTNDPEMMTTHTGSVAGRPRSSRSIDEAVPLETKSIRCMARLEADNGRGKGWDSTYSWTCARVMPPGEVGTIARVPGTGRGVPCVLAVVRCAGDGGSGAGAEPWLGEAKQPTEMKS